MESNNNTESTPMAVWDRELLVIYCDVCIKEVVEGNRPTTFFNKVGWNNITIRFNELTGKDYTKFQLKNKWDGLKKDWRIWRELMKGSTGLGWDPKRKTVDASDDWWHDRLKVVPAAKKFKIAGIDPEIEEKLDCMFGNIFATGSTSYNSRVEKPTAPLEVNTDDNAGESVNMLAESDHEVPVNPDVSRAKRPNSSKIKERSSKKKGAASQIASEVTRLVDTVVDKMSAYFPPESSSSSKSVSDVLLILKEIPEMKVNTPLFMNSLRVMKDQSVREIFLGLDEYDRLMFLKDLFNNP